MSSSWWVHQSLDQTRELLDVLHSTWPPQTCTALPSQLSGFDVPALLETSSSSWAHQSLDRTRECLAALHSPWHRQPCTVPLSQLSGFDVPALLEMPSSSRVHQSLYQTRELLAVLHSPWPQQPCAVPLSQLSGFDVPALLEMPSSSRVHQSLDQTQGRLAHSRWPPRPCTGPLSQLFGFDVLAFLRISFSSAAYQSKGQTRGRLAVLHSLCPPRPCTGPLGSDLLIVMNRPLAGSNVKDPGSPQFCMLLSTVLSATIGSCICSAKLISREFLGSFGSWRPRTSGNSEKKNKSTSQVTSQNIEIEHHTDKIWLRLPRSEGNDYKNDTRSHRGIAETLKHLKHRKRTS